MLGKKCAGIHHELLLWKMPSCKKERRRSDKHYKPGVVLIAYPLAEHILCLEPEQKLTEQSALHFSSLKLAVLACCPLACCAHATLLVAADSVVAVVDVGGCVLVVSAGGLLCSVVEAVVPADSEVATSVVETLVETLVVATAEKKVCIYFQ